MPWKLISRALLDKAVYSDSAPTPFLPLPARAGALQSFKQKSKFVGTNVGAKKPQNH